MSNLSDRIKNWYKKLHRESVFLCIGHSLIVILAVVWLFGRIILCCPRYKTTLLVSMW
jgi:hypothetical protein